MIDLTAITTITSVDDLTVTASGNDVTIDTGAGTILLRNFSESDLDADDFCFYEAPPDDPGIQGMQVTATGGDRRGG